MHIETFIKIRDINELGKRGWLNKYYIQFGIPQQLPYKRKSTERYFKAGGIEYMLQIEAILSGLLRYVRSGKGRIQLEKLLLLFENNLMRLKRNESIYIDFRTELGIPPRD